MVERVKKWYDMGLWTVSMVGNAVEKSLITPEQYREITGEAYPG